MNIQQIVSDLKSERDQINRAIAALEGTNTTAKPRPPQRAKGKSRLSAEGRKRISEAMKKRWAVRRRGNRGKPMLKIA